MRHSQNNMVVRDLRDDLTFPLRDPLLLGRPLTSWAIPVITGCVVQLDAAIRAERRIESHLFRFAHGDEQRRTSLCVRQRRQSADFISVILKNLTYQVFPGIRCRLIHHP